MSSKRDYTKEIIEEYNVRLQSWGNSDSWGLTEFKMLEDLIYESSKMRINANTLKRFFQQRTSKPQLATNNALCIFLGYSGYTEFVMRRTSAEREKEHREEKNDYDLSNINDDLIEVNYLQKEPLEEENQNEDTGSEGKSIIKKHKKHIYIILALSIPTLVLLFGWNKFYEKYTNYRISQAIIEASITKGASPLTVKFNYSIPSKLMDSVMVVFKEANGDVTQKKPEKNQGEIFMTYIYPGKGACILKYGNRIIKTIDIETRTPGWSVYVRDDRKDFFATIPFGEVAEKDGYITLPVEKIPKEVITDKLFVSYTYYTGGIVDGDNFICEARVRNSEQEDHGIPCFDIMMYAFSNTEIHGFALNRDCYSYLKFISGDSVVMGDKRDLSHIKFNPSFWHVMRIEVINKKTAFFLDGKKVLDMSYKNNFGKINEITLRFKGCGAVDYVKVLKPDGAVVYQMDF